MIDTYLLIYYAVLFNLVVYFISLSLKIKMRDSIEYAFYILIFVCVYYYFILYNNYSDKKFYIPLILSIISIFGYYKPLNYIYSGILGGLIVLIMIYKHIYKKEDKYFNVSLMFLIACIIFYMLIYQTNFNNVIFDIIQPIIVYIWITIFVTILIMILAYQNNLFSSNNLIFIFYVFFYVIILVYRLIAYLSLLYLNEPCKQIVKVTDEISMFTRISPYLSPIIFGSIGCILWIRDIAVWSFYNALLFFISTGFMMIIILNIQKIKSSMTTLLIMWLVYEWILLIIYNRINVKDIFASLIGRPRIILK